MMTQMLWCWNGGSSACQKHSFSDLARLIKPPNAQSLPRLVWHTRESQLTLCVILCAILLSAVGVQMYFLGEDDKRQKTSAFDLRLTKVAFRFDPRWWAHSGWTRLFAGCGVCLSCRWSCKHVSRPLRSPSINLAFYFKQRCVKSDNGRILCKIN